MTKIKKDHIGLYVAAGGYICRTRFGTRYKEDDLVVTKHFGGSTRAGVGKDETCLRGHYLEYWTTTGIMTVEYNSNKRQLSQVDFENLLNKYHDDQYAIMAYGHRSSFK